MKSKLDAVKVHLAELMTKPVIRCSMSFIATLNNQRNNFGTQRNLYAQYIHLQMLATFLSQKEVYNNHTTLTKIVTMSSVQSKLILIIDKTTTLLVELRY